MRWRELNSRHYELLIPRSTTPDHEVRRAVVMRVEDMRQGLRIYQWYAAVHSDYGKWRKAPEPQVFRRKKDAMEWCVAYLVAERMGP